MSLDWKNIKSIIPFIIVCSPFLLVIGVLLLNSFSLNKELNAPLPELIKQVEAEFAETASRGDRYAQEQLADTVSRQNIWDQFALNPKGDF